MGVEQMAKLDARTREDVALYSTDDLRRKYQSESGETIRLCDSIPSRAELRAEILRRVWWERWAARVTLGVAVIGAVAAIIGAAAAIVAAVEGWDWDAPEPTASHDTVETSPAAN
jgi:hypothetical protein